MAIRNIVVVGDIVLDHHLYEGDRSTPSSNHQRGVHVVTRSGGAAGVARLLQQLLSQQRNSLDGWRVHLGTSVPQASGNQQHNSFALWRPFPRIKGEPAREQVWRAAKLMGYGSSSSSPQRSGASYQPTLRPDTPKPDILVIDDAGSQFRDPANRDAWWPPGKTGDTCWVLLKMSGRLCQGKLWQACLDQFADRLVCLVSARDLRREYANINAGLSWERTVENLRRALAGDDTLKQLRHCRHLIVTFGADAALWVDQPPDGNAKAILVFDPARSENLWAEEREGQVIGALTGPAASLAAALAAQANSVRPDLTTALQAGLCAMRDLWDLGHGPVSGVAPTGYPVARLAHVLAARPFPFARIAVPWGQLAGPGSWSIAISSQGPANATKPALPIGLARQVVIRGLAALNGLPVARFGRLATADRQEIEAMRNIYHQISAYARDLSATKPLSIGVFGPPGAGKSFGVKQITTALLGEKSWLEFNLSQFAEPADLFGPFHQARDLTLSGNTPVLFWDEFDSQNYKWLQYLLAPMQDGRFQEGALSHAIGRAIFIFAGGTSHTYGSFGKLADGQFGTGFVMAKGPDFKSRLDCFYDVAGPNKRASAAAGDDTAYVLRRAILLRDSLCNDPSTHLDIDPSLLDALLLIEEYQFGARSLQKLASLLRTQDGTIRLSPLSPAQLEMHVDAIKFEKRLQQPKAIDREGLAAVIAPLMHETWRTQPRHESVHLDKPCDAVLPDACESCNTAAQRIPDLLGLAGLSLSANSDDVTDDTGIEEHLEVSLERLAEAEHDLWMAHKRRTGWAYASKRRDSEKRHDMMVPYNKLPEPFRENDRCHIRQLVTWITAAGYKVVWPPDPAA